jgi:hypothetical protein
VTIAQVANDDQLADEDADRGTKSIEISHLMICTYDHAMTILQKADEKRNEPFRGTVGNDMTIQGKRN